MSAPTVGDGYVLLSWAPVGPSDSCPTIDGYTVTMGTSPGGEGGPLNPTTLGDGNVITTTGTSYQVNGLTDGTTYYFLVDTVAVQSSGQLCSDDSSPLEVSATPTSAVGLNSISPTTGDYGTSVTISGQNFTSNGGIGSVTFDQPGTQNVCADLVHLNFTDTQITGTIAHESFPLDCSDFDSVDLHVIWQNDAASAFLPNAFAWSD
ncbi:MAG TPA: fibronectin type III domain-containing protein [Acidimicrobiales bacterium]|nr:fibronectin type III domain-containing protein [Acidimicrobiales bacterium]